MYKILKSILAIALLLLIQQLDAQEVSNKDKVYLKQGSVLVGTITSYSPGESLEITLRSGNTLTIRDEQVRKVVMYDPKESNTVKAYVPMKEGRLYNETQFSFLTNADGTGYSLAHNLLFQKGQYLAFGIGLGLDNYYGAPGREVVPVYANAKYYFMKDKNTPFVGMKMGYGFAFTRENYGIIEAEGGLMTNPYFGIRMGSRGLIWNLYTGLKFQKLDYVVRSSWDTRREDILHRRLEIGTSIMF